MKTVRGKWHEFEGCLHNGLPALVERINRLRALGVEHKLQAMEKDPSRDVRDRVRTALDQLTSIDT